MLGGFHSEVALSVWWARLDSNRYAVRRQGDSHTKGILSRYSFSEVSTPNWTILDFSAPAKCANCDKFRNYPISTDTKRQPSFFFSYPRFPLVLQWFFATWRDVGGMKKVSVRIRFDSTKALYQFPRC